MKSEDIIKGLKEVNKLVGDIEFNYIFPKSDNEIFYLTKNNGDYVYFTAFDLLTKYKVVNKDG